VEDDKEIEDDRQRAEVFDALGHPTRIVILKALSEGALGFADLKKKTVIESSGHLQHHLTKLNGLIKTDEYGKYCLSDQGKDALLTVQTVENASGSRTKSSEKSHQRHFDTNMVLKSVSLLLMALIIASSAIAVVEYNRASVLQKEIVRINEISLEAMAYYNEFGVIPATNVNSSFSPPVSMYRALQMALQAEGWNKTSLNGMTVGAYLMNSETATYSDANGNGTSMLFSYITNPPSDYSDVNGNGVIYRYVWQIIVRNSTVIQIPPPGFSLIDAATAEIIPHGFLI
jgi:DNA-binding HxlR family transcriptional regulator